MTAYDHLLSRRASQFWRFSELQQKLLAAEILDAANTIKNWRGVRDNDERELLKSEMVSLTSTLLGHAPLDVCVIQDQEHEIDEDGMLSRFEDHVEFFEAGPVMVGSFDIWTVLVRAGTDKFSGLDAFDEAPSAVIPDSIKRGNGSLHFLGAAGTPEDALCRLREAGFFDNDD